MPSSVAAYRTPAVSRSAASSVTYFDERPVLMALHVTPASTERNTPTLVPAYTVPFACGSTTRTCTSPYEGTMPSTVHAAPPSVERQTEPCMVPAYKLAGTTGSMANDSTSSFVTPTFTAFQWSPASVERKTESG